MSTKRTGVPCYDHADLDEPVFVLRAKDRLAPPIIRIWALAAKVNGAPEEKWKSAESVAQDMEKWAAEHSSKIPGTQK